MLLDVGHGAASFGRDVAARAIATGCPPHTISTDVHVRNIGGPVHDLATTMTKLLACGMPLKAVVAAVTTTPRAGAAGSAARGSADDGAVRHATVFRLTARRRPAACYRDATGAVRDPGSHIVPVATISNGRLRAC